MLVFANVCEVKNYHRHAQKINWQNLQGHFWKQLLSAYSNKNWLHTFPPHPHPKDIAVCYAQGLWSLQPLLSSTFPFSLRALSCKLFVCWAFVRPLFNIHGELDDQCWRDSTERGLQAHIYKHTHTSRALTAESISWGHVPLPGKFTILTDPFTLKS